MLEPGTQYFWPLEWNHFAERACYSMLSTNNLVFGFGNILTVDISPLSNRHAAKSFLTKSQNPVMPVLLRLFQLLSRQEEE